MLHHMIAGRMLRPTYGVSDTLNEKVVLHVPPLSSFECGNDLSHL